jgi:Flp pilus assembly pilin Flp
VFNKSRFFRLSDRGQSLSEYAVIIGLAAIVVVAGIYFYRTKLSSAYKGAAKDVAAVDASPATTRSGSLPSSSQIENIQNQARQLWASPRFKLMLLGLVFLIMCLMFLNQYRAQKRLGRTQSLSGENGDNGQAMTEFVLAFPVMLLTILIIFQMSLLFIGHFMLNYAAFCAARTAAVWIPADLTKSEQGNGQGGGQSNSGG